MDSAAIEHQIDRLGRLLAPATEGEIASKLKELFAGLASRNLGESEETRAKVYRDALRPFSRYAVEAVITAATQGQIDAFDKVYVPTSAQLADACRKAESEVFSRRCRMEAELRRRAQLQHALAPPDDATRARIAEGLKALAASLSAEIPERDRRQNPFLAATDRLRARDQARATLAAAKQAREASPD